MSEENANKAADADEDTLESGLQNLKAEVAILKLKIESLRLEAEVADAEHELKMAQAYAARFEEHNAERIKEEKADAGVAQIKRQHAFFEMAAEEDEISSDEATWCVDDFNESREAEETESCVGSGNGRPKGSNDD